MRLIIWPGTVEEKVSTELKKTMYLLCRTFKPEQFVYSLKGEN